MAHVTTQEAEELLDQTLPVLDHGFVRLIDYMGGDSSIVQAARVSYGEGTKTVREDRGLINYLMRHRHTTPFEMVDLKFHIKLPIFVARQWIRHRTASVNEVSGRYSIIRDEFYVPSEEHIGFQSTSNRQGRAEDEVPPQLRAHVLEVLGGTPEAVYPRYEELLEAGIARELARICLPVSAYTEWYWKINLHNLFHFLSLRADPHAQYEIRAYADQLSRCTRAVAPMAYAAFEEYVLGAVTLSRHEAAIVRRLLASEDVSWSDFAYFGERTYTSEGKLNRALESRRQELSQKMGFEVVVAEPAGEGLAS